MTVQDPRPEFHFTATEGWINDPLGLTWKDGKYHLFYQYVPGRSTWASNCHWGHATSPDMVSWSEQEIALAPGDGDDGIWSGSIATDATGQSTLFYTSVQEPEIGIGSIRTATPDDDTWNRWTKGPEIVRAPGLGVVAYRDPFVFRDGDKWRMLVGAGLNGGIGAAISYSSPDLAGWELDGIAAQRPGSDRDQAWTGTMWECPQLFEIDGSHVLVTSIWEDDVLHYVAYGIGSYKDGMFTARTWKQLSYGAGYYAPSFFRDKDGKPSLIFWIRGVISPDRKWASALSIPHTLTLENDTLIATPHEDLGAYAVQAHLAADDSDSFNAVLPAGADFRWIPSDETAIDLKAGETTLATLKQANNELIINIPDNNDFTDVRLPAPAGTRVRAIIDNGTLEISSRAGVAAVPLPLLEDPLSLFATGLLEPPQLQALRRTPPTMRSSGPPPATTPEHLPAP
ncbi:glycoside hydrolase family 32 protein [Arthrobacter sp. MI7-26]|uniref:glycoside hydrolase family 32 protein n=1 Tax=Arthrobacter sp. MI7-26 TaxID=2993653 RepID=UPI00224943C5|nr:glycoside hydrolase family 32 protein [Arthrobacter sp. MI7-26]MCX2748775.1 glycoside hydrolase family 32 protein [Arthrobacter sp. MI7-26]